MAREPITAEDALEDLWGECADPASYACLERVLKAARRVVERDDWRRVMALDLALKGET
jgi:hypothetical protein